MINDRIKGWSFWRGFPGFWASCFEFSFSLVYFFMPFLVLFTSFTSQMEIIFLTLLTPITKFLIKCIDLENIVLILLFRVHCVEIKITSTNSFELPKIISRKIGNSQLFCLFHSWAFSFDQFFPAVKAFLSLISFTLVRFISWDRTLLKKSSSHLLLPSTLRSWDYAE